MDAPQNITDKRWTYADYRSCPENRPWELINGVAQTLSFTPSRRHQQVLGALLVQFLSYSRLCGRKYEAYTSLDVRLPDSAGQHDDEITTVVKPDIFVVGDLSKLDDRGCVGAPDLIVEILSSENAIYDHKIKLNLYQRMEIKEFWLVQPVDGTVMVCKLTDAGVYGRPEMYGRRDLVPVPMHGELMIDLAEVFFETAT